MKNFIFTTEKGDPKIYTNEFIIKPETKPGSLEIPTYIDIRGKIERKKFGKFKYNIIETKKGFMRSGDIHKNTQFNFIMSGKIELWTLVNDITKKIILGPNQYIILQPHIPHLFNYLEDTVMIEYWDGPFETWYYKPYRDIIDQNFIENTKNN